MAVDVLGVALTYQLFDTEAGEGGRSILCLRKKERRLSFFGGRFR